MSVAVFLLIKLPKAPEMPPISSLPAIFPLSSWYKVPHRPHATFGPSSPPSRILALSIGNLQVVQDAATPYIFSPCLISTKVSDRAVTALVSPSPCGMSSALDATSTQSICLPGPSDFFFGNLVEGRPFRIVNPPRASFAPRTGKLRAVAAENER
eukprot:CAMPEP_0185765336 /NCGR_PEP_ID=MMETSP1174-20130828/28808_1 /TAXON_ID=35687 /ORGANISM="Dictyocha speculum, Strain CCMP1381" /LENGTH=154 /DNA_ID=CAMNT_0028448405 /DNA_START=1076 /DNA_END=1540 /DNA_ORIENTATION=-